MLSIPPPHTLIGESEHPQWYAVSMADFLKGDVNGDGVVDVADINAVINIIKNNAGTATAYK